MLCVYVEFEDNNPATVDITPIMYDDEASPGVVAPLASKTFTFASGAAILRGSSANYISQILTWDLVGAYKVGLHISNYSEDGNGHPINVWGYVI
ncbi:MAG: hypothetical protein B7C24_16565 [Bacteroidetes bacterium 4572_77]|nr:MAG: hypothetical protein B7C24_16565 [Bacteroidetes bacterium 4572_77]